MRPDQWSWPEPVETGPKQVIHSWLQVLFSLHSGFSVRPYLKLENSGLDRIRPNIDKSNFEEEYSIYNIMYIPIQRAL